MKKSDRKLLAETLDKALEPPPKRKPALASHLAEYEEGSPVSAESSKQVTPPDPTSRGVTPPDPLRPTAPQRDFNKRANSLDRCVPTVYTRLAVMDRFSPACPISSRHQATWSHSTIAAMRCPRLLCAFTRELAKVDPG